MGDHCKVPSGCKESEVVFEVAKAKQNDNRLAPMARGGVIDSPFEMLRTIEGQSTRIAELEAALRGLTAKCRSLPPCECDPGGCVCGYSDFQRQIDKAEEVLRGH